MASSFEFANDLAQAQSLMRRYFREQIAQGKMSPAEAFRYLTELQQDTLQDFMTEHDVPGVKYYQGAGRVAPEAVADEPLNEFVKYLTNCVEIERHEFLSRLGLHFGYKDHL